MIACISRDAHSSLILTLTYTCSHTAHRCRPRQAGQWRRRKPRRYLTAPAPLRAVLALQSEYGFSSSPGLFGDEGQTRGRPTTNLEEPLNACGSFAFVFTCVFTWMHETRDEILTGFYTDPDLLLLYYVPAAAAACTPACPEECLLSGRHPHSSRWVRRATQASP